MEDALINCKLTGKRNFTTQKKRHNVNHYSTYSVMIASVVERFNRTLKNDMWQRSIEIINESIRSRIKLQRESIELSACDPLTSLKFRECRVRTEKKYSSQVNARNKYPIKGMCLQKFYWRKEKFSLFFNARYVQLAELLHFILGSSYIC